jgi:transcriptional regulator with XRE-family HTH domain
MSEPVAPSALRRRVKRLRKARGLGQRSLAAKAKVSQGLIHQLETAKVQDVRSQVAVKLAKAIGVSLTELLG